MLGSWAKWLAGRGLGDDWLTVAGLYTEIDDGRDSALRARLAPRTGWAGFSPDAGLPRDAVVTLLREAARNKIRVAGIWPYLIELFAEADRAAPISGERWVLGHQAVLSRDQIARIRDLGVVLTTHTNRHIYKDGARLRDRVGEAAADTIVPLRSLLDAGVAVSFGSDNLPPSLFHPIWHAVARAERERGDIIAPRQRISRLEALRCASTAGAYLCFDETQRGSIEPGKLADLAVLSDDPLNVELDTLPHVTSAMTIVGGRVVHSL
jgi:predicted amidohydrolase YtcJ